MTVKKHDEFMDVSNIVGMVDLAENFDLNKLYIELENTSFEPEQFSGLVYRSKSPEGTVILFKSGKAICTGAKDQKSVELIISELVNKLRFLDIKIKKNFKVQIKNMVFTRTLEKSINLAKVALSFGLEEVEYEPKDFPGLIYRIEEPRATFILFESGKIICTGSESTELAEKAYGLLEKKLKRNKII